ncbi:MAG: BamA/TamA family outer membrane protein [Paludibacteraceae bacterium]|nr:BamA/TamA family outer membrane protein [Paludibacteraceae bacterium]
MSHAISLDSLLNLPAMGIPVVNYSPESTWEFGAAGQGYFRLPNQERTSIIQLDGTYSLNRQWYLNAQGNLHFGTPGSGLRNNSIRNWQLQFRAGYSNRPSTYYGTYDDSHFANEGNMDIGMLRKGTPYQLQRGYFSAQAPIYIGKHFALGPMADVLIAQFAIQDIYTTSDPLVQVGLGAVAQYDTRDNVFYPTQGIFFKASAAAAWTNKRDIPQGQQATINGLLAADLRQYISLPHDLVFAWQLKGQFMLSSYFISHLTLYPMLPRLGGQDGLRGINSDMFRDDIMMALQAELRIPIWSIFRGAIFAGVGDVYDFHNWHWEIPKVGYGLGIRAAINKAKVNIRFDVARSNVDPRWNNINAYSFYLTATEAF